MRTVTRGRLGRSQVIAVKVSGPIGRQRAPALVVAAALTLVLAACSGSFAPFGRHGEGAVQTETRTVAAFSRIDVSAGIRVVGSIGPAQPLTVSAQANILPVIATDVVDGTLRIHSTEGYTSTEPVQVTFVSPTLDGLVLSGGSNSGIQGLAATTLSAELSGGSVLTAAGTATTVRLVVSGGSRVDLGGLAATSVAVEASGGSNVTVQASGTVSGSASGAAHVTVGGGAQVSVEATGGAVVTTQ